MLNSPPAGWYADPNGAHALRYWDGRSWTEAVAPANSEAPATTGLTTNRQPKLATPTFAGWYPDERSGGTAYWDGSRWTGDTRPRRRRFAAASRQDGPGFALAFLFAVGVAGLSYGGYAEEGSANYLWFGGLGLASIALAVIYLLRGRGPSTEAIERRLSTAWGEADPHASPTGGTSSTLFAAAAGFALGAAARGTDDPAERDYEYLAVPSGLARKWWSFNEVNPVMAMRVDRFGSTQITFDGSTWEDPKGVSGDWVVGGGDPFEWP